MNDYSSITIGFNGVPVEKVRFRRIKLNMTPDYATSEELLKTTRALELARERREKGEKSTTPVRPLYMYEPGRNR